MREVLGPIGRWLLRPTTVGALVLLALVLYAALAGAGADEALRGQSRVIAEAAASVFAGEVRRMEVAIAALAIVEGVVLGLAASWLVHVRDRVHRRKERSRASLAAATLVIVLLTEALLELWAMADSPQLYADAWYARGGARRTVQVLATDVVGKAGPVLLALVFVVAYLAGPRSGWRRWPRRLRRALLPRGRSIRAAAPLASALLALVTLSAGAFVGRVARAETADTTGQAPMNVVILAVDSMRADRLDPRVAPHLSALAGKGTRFDRAYVSLPRTFPSWVTLLTGRYPHHHGIRSMFPRWEEREKDFDALPGRLVKAGYATRVVSDFAGDIFDRVDLGFQKVQAPHFDFRVLVRQRALERQTPLLPILNSWLGRLVVPAVREMSDAADPQLVAGDAVRAIDAMKDGPFFLTAFFSTAHFPYAAPAPYYRRFTRSAYRGRFKYHKPVGLESDLPPDDADVAQIRGLYDGAIASVDDAAQRILDALERKGLLGHTIVVLTADHGEALYENGHGSGHGDHLFGDEGTHVPLVVFDPRRARKGRVSGVVRDVDLAPTLYDLLGVPAPKDLDGASLTPAMEGQSTGARLAHAETGLWFTESIEGLPAELRLPYPGVAGTCEVDSAHGDEVVLKTSLFDTTLVAKHRMVRDDRYKLVYAPTRAGVAYRMFDTLDDPFETIDVAARLPDVFARLKGELWKWMLSDPAMTERDGYLVPR